MQHDSFRNPPALAVGRVKGYGDQTAAINGATEAVITAGMAISGLIGILTNDKPE